MSRVHLDTSFLIRSLTPGSAESHSLRGWLVEGTQVRISLIAWAEFLCGPVRVDEIALARRIVGTPFALTEADAPMAARLFNESGRKRGSFVDCLVAAAAIRDRAVLATANLKDFRPFARAGLNLDLPLQAP